MKTHNAIFILLLQILPHFPSISCAVEYQVFNDALNTPGGARFQSEIGFPYTVEIMQTINYVIWDIFRQYNETDRYNIETVKVIIQRCNETEAVTYGDNINVSSTFLEGYKGNLKWEFTSLLHHEMTRVFQWNGQGKAPSGLLEGVGGYTVLKSSYYPPGFAKRGQGERWDQGYDFTARFLEYCDELKPGFVAELNKMMRYDYSESYFQVLLGKTVDQLWADYKAKYHYHDK